MDFLTKTLGRVLYAIPFIIFGIIHFAFGRNMAGMVPAWVPGGVIWVYLTALFMIAAGVAIIVGRYASLACKLLALLLLIYIVTIHIPGLSHPDKMVMMTSLSSLLKDTALMGAALSYAGQLS